MSERTGLLHNRYIAPVINSLGSFFFGTEEHTSQTPYIRDAIDLKRYMFFVILAVLPSAVAGIYLYGWRVVAVIAVSYVFGVGTEAVFAGVRRQDEIHEGAFVTCILYALILPPHLPLWIVAVGIMFGTIFGKEVFGGTGKNIFNPAMVGRIFVSLAFPEAMAKTWVVPFDGPLPGGFSAWMADTITTATPLTLFQSSGDITAASLLFRGYIGGCIGETVKPLIILGGLFLIVTKVANWRIPVAFFLSSFGCAALLHSIEPQQFAPAWFHLLSGGLLFAGMFMISDPVTTPTTNSGKWICGFSLGVLTILIRVFTGYVEGVMFAVIIMNMFAPLIDYSMLNIKYRARTRKAAAL